MARVFLVGFWDSVSNLILKNRILIIALLVLATSFFISQWQYIKFSNTEANLLPDNHEVNLEYLDFTNKFGEEGNLIVIGIKDSLLFTTENLNAWNNLSKVLKDTSFVESVIAIGDLQKLKKDKKKQQFYLEPFIKDTITSDIELISIKKELFEKYPFYDEFLFNTKTKSVRTPIITTNNEKNVARYDLKNKKNIIEVIIRAKITKVEISLLIFSAFFVLT